MKWIVILIIALASASAKAEEIPCAEGGPDSHAPHWAVLLQQKQKFICSRPDKAGVKSCSLGPVAEDDPIWQHASCDEAHHRITWSFPH